MGTLAAGEAKSDGAGGSGPYAVPEGDAAELLKFVGGLLRIDPDTPEEDATHRAKFRPALQEAAQRIMPLEKEPGSEAYRVARFVLLSNRVHWVAQATADEQRKVVADVEDYVRENLEDGHPSQAAKLAKVTAEALSLAGRWDLAADASEAFFKLLEKSDDAGASDMAQTMAAKAEELSAMVKELPPCDNAEVLPQGRVAPLDLEKKFNWRSVDVSDGDFHGNGIAELPKGEPTLGGVKFRTSDKMLQLGCTDQAAPAAISGIPVNRKIARLYFLLAAQYAHPSRVSEGDKVGAYKMHYRDGSDESMPLMFGQHLRDWWIFDEGKPITRGRVVWTGANPASERQSRSIRLYMATWENPHPEREVTHLDFVGIPDGRVAPFCFAISAEEVAE